jgi:hypothetical protein
MAKIHSPNKLILPLIRWTQQEIGEERERREKEEFNVKNN